MTADKRTELAPGPAATVPSAKVADRHLRRLAVVYVRQSTPRQVRENAESTARQYDLPRRAVALGWPPDRVVVIDDDLGRSGREAATRPGFQRLLAEVGLDHVGLILGLEMSRLARSCRDWHQLLELCGVFHTLLADPDGVYDPTDHNDRLLLGLSGIMSEAELHVMRNRLDQGKRNKANRGELFTCVPAGYVRLPGGGVDLDPDEQVREVIRMAFDLFAELGSARAVAAHLRENGVRLPLRKADGTYPGPLLWREARAAVVYHMYTNPTYAGAYVYGRSPVDPRRREPGSGRRARCARPMDQWPVVLRDRLPGYITWDQYLANRARLHENASRWDARRDPPRGRNPAGVSSLRPVRVADVRPLPGPRPGRVPVRPPGAPHAWGHGPVPGGAGGGGRRRGRGTSAPGAGAGGPGVEPAGPRGHRAGPTAGARRLGPPAGAGAVRGRAGEATVRRGRAGEPAGRPGAGAAVGAGIGRGAAVGGGVRPLPAGPAPRSDGRRPRRDSATGGRPAGPVVGVIDYAGRPAGDRPPVGRAGAGGRPGRWRAGAGGDPLGGRAHHRARHPPRRPPVQSTGRVRGPAGVAGPVADGRADGRGDRGAVERGEHADAARDRRLHRGGCAGAAVPARADSPERAARSRPRRVRGAGAGAAVGRVGQRGQGLDRPRLGARPAGERGVGGVGRRRRVEPPGADPRRAVPAVPAVADDAEATPARPAAGEEQTTSHQAKEIECAVTKPNKERPTVGR